MGAAEKRLQILGSKLASGHFSAKQRVGAARSVTKNLKQQLSLHSGTRHDLLRFGGH